MKKNSLLIIALALVALLVNACANGSKSAQNGNVKEGYNSMAVIEELSNKVKSYDAFGYTISLPGVPDKRMYFRFVKDGTPHYSFRSETQIQGRSVVNLNNVDGFDYQILPDSQLARRAPTTIKTGQEDVYGLRMVQVEYSRGKVMSASAVDGKDCYVINTAGNEYCVSKETGLPLSIKGPKGIVLYKNFTTEVPDSLFAVPPFVKIVDAKSSSPNSNSNANTKK